MKTYIYDRWWWMCLALAIALAAAILVIFGISLWTAALAALLLVCPVLMLWGVIEFRPPRRNARGSGEPHRE